MEPVAGKRMHFFVPSGLDPPLLSVNDEVEHLEEFKSQDTIEDIEEWGGNEWWDGDPQTIKANKRKYLKRAD
jgi:hypothetical protein